jgi:3-phytase
MVRSRVLVGLVAGVATVVAASVLAATGTQATAVRTVLPVVETAQFPAGSGDIADDSAIWFDAADPAASLVVADSKSRTTGGVAVYDLAGRLLQYLPAGMIGNVDLRDGFPLGGRSVVLVGANDRTSNTMVFWTLDPATRSLTPATARDLPTLTPNYGFCLYRSPVSGRFYAFVDQAGGGLVEQYELLGSEGGVDARLVRSFVTGTQTEGCVADDERGLVYLGEEDVAIWRYGAEPDAGSARVAVDRVGAGHLVADVEGLSISYGPDGSGFLFASSQGDSTVAVYDRAGANPFVASFTVAANGGIDAVTSTDGVAVHAGDFGGAFAGGLVVVHDASNGGGTMSNLKYVPLDAVLAGQDERSITLPVVADAYTRSTSRTSNFGTATKLRVSHDGSWALLRFDTSALPPGVRLTSVALEPYSPSAAGCRYEVHPVTDDWVERTVTAATLPEVSPVVLGTSATLPSRKRMPVPLPPAAVPAGTTVSFAVRATSGCAPGYLSSRETSNGARLVVGYAVG